MSNRQLAVLIVAIAALFFIFKPADAAPAQQPYYPQQADPAGCAAANSADGGGFYTDACKPAYQVQP